MHDYTPCHTSRHNEKVNEAHKQLKKTEYNFKKFSNVELVPLNCNFLTYFLYISEYQLKIYTISNGQSCQKKLHWSYAVVFVAFWLLLYWSIIATQINRLPKPLKHGDEWMKPNEFIAERALQILYNLTSLGPRVVGSQVNEIEVIDFLINEIQKVQSQANEQIEIEWNVQEASGSYIHWSMLNIYQSIQNVIVKLKCKNSTSDNYVLINSHYDSVPGSPGAGDDGSMVAVMLEVMRILAKSTEYFKHPIIFLFNGAEENPLQASHAFITQHKWAKNCKCLINLDSAGNGGRELLFQSGPEHPWLMDYYRQVPHPFANTVAEEMFQAGLIPSDTDFHIFRDYAQIPGYDIAYVLNGYVYHTKYDKLDMIRGAASLQHTGDNILTLTKLLANAVELEHEELLNSKGHVIFYDFLGFFMVFYTASMGLIINVIICLITVPIILLSVYTMTLKYQINIRVILFEFAIIFIIHILSIVMAASLTLIIAYFMDAINNSMSWFSEKWLILGIYISPMLFAMGIGPAYYVKSTTKNPVDLFCRIQLFLYSHCLLLIVITMLLTCIGIRSAFMFTIAIVFEMLTLIIQLLIEKWSHNDNYFVIIQVSGQVIPFVYYTSIGHLIYATLIPMTGRGGSNHNPDVLISGIAICCSILFAGFIMPIFLLFRKTCSIVSTFLLMNWIFIFMAISSIGFPYRNETASQRLHFIHAQRIMYNMDESVRSEESGVYVYPQDRHIDRLYEYFDLLGVSHQLNDEYCTDSMYCGMPIFNHRWHNGRKQSLWIPIKEKPVLPGLMPELKLISAEYFANTNKTVKRHTFTLMGPDHMTIFVGVKNNAQIINWTFNKDFLNDNWPPPYFIYFSYGKRNETFTFGIDVEIMAEALNNVTLEIGIGGHWLNQNLIRPQHLRKFLNSLPEWICVTDWVATYESWLF